MKSTAFVIERIKELSEKFPDIQIRYEYREHKKLHLVEILPLKIFESGDYIIEETEFDDDFTEYYPEEDIIFISSDSLNEIRNTDFEIG
jgi:hypothetical protein